MKCKIFTKKLSFITIPLFLAILMFGMVYHSYLNMKQNDMAEAKAQFDQHVQELATAIRTRMTTYKQVLYGTRALFQASQNISRSEFKTYIDNLNINSNFPGIQGVGYAMVVAPDKKDAWTQQIRKKELPDFEIKPDYKRDFYTAIYYLEPYDWRNKRAIGYDMYSNAVRKKAMQAACDSADAVLSGKVTLVQETNVEVQPGFLIYLPLYKKNSRTETVEARRKNLVGWIYAPFRAKDFFYGMQGETNRFFDVELYDQGAITPANLLLDTKPNSKGSQLTAMIEIELEGHQWVMVVKSTQIFELEHMKTRAELILGIGIFGSLILAFFIGQLIYRKNHIEYEILQVNKQLRDSEHELKDLNLSLEDKVDEKTKALEETNASLESHIKDLEKVNAKLKNAKRDALQAAQARSNFISGISHELRTPLNAIINFTDQVLEDFDEMLDDAAIQEDSKKFLDRVMINSRHLLQLINDLLEFTKAEAGKMDYTMKDYDINEIIKTAYSSTYSLLHGIDVDLKLQLAATPLIGWVDSRRFLQILLNLLSNAIKFTEHGWIEIRSFSWNDKLIVEVEDTGRGIADEKQAVIFDPFMQVNNHDHGTGLGLGLVKRMCMDMGVTVSFSSVEGKGTTFRLELKLNDKGSIG